MSTAAAPIAAVAPPVSAASRAIRSPVLRAAVAEDAPAIHRLIEEHRNEGRLLPRDAAEIARHAHRFAVADDGIDIFGCAELAPLSRELAEIRSLVVADDARQRGFGSRIVVGLIERAAAAGFFRLCAFTHAPSFFVRLGFSMVPHVWLREKILTDCHACPLFRRCGQYAVVRPLGRNAALRPAGSAAHG